MKNAMKITAIVGDIHGHHHMMESMLAGLERNKNLSIESILQVGDFEAHRHETDLATMASLRKYRRLGDFHQYYQGICEFTRPVYFIGGNHEPYGWYDQHPEGTRLMKR